MEISYILLAFSFSTVISSDTNNFSDDITISIEDEYAIPLPCYEFCDPDNREKRSSAPIRSRILDVMKRTPTLRINPAERDIFDIVRDKYELPKGKFNSVQVGN